MSDKSKDRCHAGPSLPDATRGTSVALHQALIDSLDQPVWLVDQDFKILIFNQRAVEYFHGSFGATIQSGMRLPDFPLQTSAGRWPDMVNRVLSGESLDIELPTARGPVHRAVMRRVPLAEDFCVSMAVRQDTPPEPSKTTLKENDSHYRAIFENNHVAILIIDSESGNIIEANPAAVKYYGYPANTLTSMKIMDLNTLPPKKVRSLMHAAKQQSKRFFNFQHRLADGSIRDVEVFSGPIKAHNKTYLFSIIIDVTERKRAVETLRQYERIIASNPNLIALVDRNHIYRMVNDAFLKVFNKEREEIVGKSVTSVLGREHFEGYSKQPLETAFAGESTHLERAFTRPGEGTLHFSITYHPVHGEDGSIDYVSVDAHDITQLKNFSDRLSLATSAGKIGIWEWDIQTDRLFWDDMMMELYRVRPDEFSAMLDAWHSRMHPDDLEGAKEMIATAMANADHTLDTEFRIIWPDGDIRHIKAAALIRTIRDKPVRMTGVSWDVTKMRRLEAELRLLATTDPLTGASNRRHFTDQAKAEFQRAKRYGTPLAIFILDLDHFKSINDTYGHLAGDQVLKRLVAHCKSALRSSDVFGRWGGEEFAAVLAQVDKESGLNTAERLRRELGEIAVEAEGNTIRFTVSVGFSAMRPDDASIENILKRADDALYLAKKHGRNNVESI